jgi:hypothetical protein
LNSADSTKVKRKGTEFVTSILDLCPEE